ncbi:class I SAM-dependent methyltransferase [Streptomyces sp. LaBMicrA B280]|uniref:class I SAM-dependent methyltransferase n=1 Tax=Streptomyces sp. LaBMicrA B280 TaxID=3391001 RepID=UPI003BA51C35
MQHREVRSCRTSRASCSLRPPLLPAPPGYTPELFERLRDLSSLDGTQRALDLGTGPGVLALPLSRTVREVVAVDPEPGMLDEVRKAGAEQGVANVQWVPGDSAQLTGLEIGGHARGHGCRLPLGRP